MGLFFSGGSDLIDTFQDPSLGEAHSLFDYAYVRNNANWFFYIGCAIPFAASYIQDRKSGYIRFLLTRTSLLNFSIARFLACVVAGGTVAATSCLIFWLLCVWACHSILPISSEVAIPIEGFLEMGPYAQLLGSGNLLGYMALYFGAQFLYGAFWATIGLSLSAMSSHSYIAYVMPFVIGLLFIQINVITDFPGWINPIYISQRVNFEDILHTFIFINCSYGVYLIALYSIFVAVLKRRWSNG